MEDLQTWRALLGKVISDPQERQRIADTLGVNPVTLTRWSTNKSNPRYESLRLLLDALPSYRQQILESAKKEFPDFFTERGTSGENALEIPSTFYARVLSAYVASLPMLRGWSVCIAILQQILGHFDPSQQGLIAVIIQCVPPPPGQKVRSLRTIWGRGTPPWPNHIENQTQFLGAESQAGHAIAKGHLIVVHNQQEKAHLFPHQYSDVGSSVACPILLSDRTVGCLYIASTQPNYFSQAHLELIQCYTDLLVLAFELTEFYHLRDIDLGFMPHHAIQLPYLERFQKCVMYHMVQAKQHGTQLTRPQAETTCLARDRE